MKKLLSSAIGILFLLGTTGTLNAAVIFSDNFDAENGGVGALNYNSFAKWSVSDGTVDLIGNGFFDFLPGNGLYIDLDGSTNNTGVMAHTESLGIGDYTLSFDLAGNHRNNNVENTLVDVSIQAGGGTPVNQNYSLAQGVGFTNFSLDFSVTIDPSDILIRFGALGGDNIGMLLDNVVLADAVAAVPEPAIITLFGLGLLGLGFARRKVRS